MTESKSNGWVILSEDKKIIYDFTFSSTRTQAQKNYSRLWDIPKNWKGHYQNGVRCIKATRTILLLNK